MTAEELEVDVKTKDGLTAHAQVVSVARLRRGRVVHLRDYFLDPTVEEAI